ncbi:uncharacterized protein FJT64_015540 [Amphibalanus amphitrite]|uniref:CCHC-type domain-containing protein n=1 Tax=Amphibalanus amphitrite TaxID=1232801 RepID=A0A6A4X8X8_AMPAM|nr:uncharacterized protein FJT64_015540 [Amphibalanus amphitrite]
MDHLQQEAEEGLLPNRLLTASRAVASVATEVLEEAERAAREVAACRAALAEAQRAAVPDVAWTTGGMYHHMLSGTHRQQCFLHMAWNVVNPADLVDGKPIRLATWEGKFVNYLLAISGDTFNPARQRAVLLHCVGDEAYRLYGTLPPGVKADGETDFDLALRQLREFYTPRTNVIVERFNFRQRGQHDSETTADFVSALRGLARTCEFGAITDELIRDVVVEKTVHPRLRERFLQDKDLTLEKVLVMAEAFERSLREAAAMAPPALQLGAVAKVSTGPRRRTTQPSLPSPATQCTNCGRKDHQPRDKSCPAKKVVCHQCGRKGHFSAWCRSKEKPPACKELQVLSCSTSTSSKMTCTASVTASTGVQRDVLLQVDTGASCSILSMDLARKLFKGVPYESSTASLYGFAKTPLSVKGTLPTVVRFNGQEATTDFFLVETPNQEAIMGLNLINALGITLHPASNSIYSVEAEAQPLPAIEHYEHRIVLKPDDATDALPESEIRAASEADPALSEVREAIRTGWPASARECSPTLRPFFDVRHELQLRDDNIILRGPDRVVVPLALIDKYLQVAHRSHEGIVRTKQLLRNAGLHTRVQTQQRRNERNYNRRRGVKVPTIQPGDKVRVRRPGHTPKNLSRFGPTQTVVRRLGKATFLLSDGTRYNASHLALAPAASSAETSDGDSPAAGLDPLPTVADQRETAHAPRPVTPRREGLPAVRGDPPGSPAPDGRRSATPAPVDSPRSPRRSGNELPPSSFGRRRFQPRKLAT